MKKTTIKRRKRVVPALRDQSPTAATHSSNGSSASPETSPAALPDYQDDYRYVNVEPMQPGRMSPHGVQRPYTFAPPPVDFTNYNTGPLSLPHHPPPPPRLLEPERINAPCHSPAFEYKRRSLSPNSSGNPNSKKRSLAEVASSADALTVPTTLESGSNQLPPIISSPGNPSPPARLSSISTLLNNSSMRDEQSGSSLDPSLASLSRNQQPHPHHHPQSQSPHQHQPSQLLPGVNELDNYKLGRRAQLQREADEMREALRVKERELAQLRN